MASGSILEGKKSWNPTEQQKRAPGCLGIYIYSFIGDYTTQFYRDYDKPMITAQLTSSRHKLEMLRNPGNKDMFHPVSWTEQQQNHYRFNLAVFWELEC